MSIVDDIQRPVEKDMARYESYLADSFRSDYPFVQTILDHILSGKGKGIRPLMAMLSAALHNEAGGPLPEKSSLAAMLVEMIHNASLVHDDIVDGARIRRGRASVNALWESQAAVLMGDYILARCYKLGLGEGVYDILGCITGSMVRLCEGELVQSDQSNRLEMTRDIYFDIIYNKTATLMGTSCAVGALSVGAAAERVDRIREFGDMVGMAFQIKDDILDYSGPEVTGKPSCGDIRERKINLPLLLVMEKSDAAGRRHIGSLLGGVLDDPSAVDTLSEMVIGGGGLDMASAVMDDYISRARAALGVYPASAVRDSLDLLCTYVASRKN